MYSGTSLGTHDIKGVNQDHGPIIMKEKSDVKQENINII